MSSAQARADESSGESSKDGLPASEKKGASGKKMNKILVSSEKENTWRYRRCAMTRRVSTLSMISHAYASIPAVKTTIS